MLPSRLRVLRLRARLTQPELGYKAGVSKQTIQNIEYGRSPNIRIETLLRLAGALGLRAIDVLPTLVKVHSVEEVEKLLSPDDDYDGEGALPTSEESAPEGEPTSCQPTDVAEEGTREAFA